MAGAGYDSDLNSEEEEDARTAINIIPEDNRFEFTVLKCPVMDELKETFPDTLDLLVKWGFMQRMKFVDYGFNKPFQSHQKNDFVLSFFLSRAVKPTLLTNRGPGTFDIMTLAHDIDGIDAEEVPCNILNMEFFDRLWTQNMVDKETNEMIKSSRDRWGDIPLNDEVRKMLMLEYSDFWDVYSAEERKEFLFQIFKNLLLCGDYDKFDTEVCPYLHTTRIIYKKLLSVIRDQNTGVITVDSPVFKVEAKMGEYRIFPSCHGAHQTFCYFVVDNKKKRLRVWFSLLP